MPKVSEEISIDEALSCRKDFVDDDGVMHKALAQKTSWNDEERSATFVMSVETEDRYRDIVEQDGIDLTHFKANPVALFGHRSWDMPIGLWSDVKGVRSSPKRTEGKMTFTDEGVDEVADRAARHVKAGTLRACSIGFQPKTVLRIMDDDGAWTFGLRFKASELYEGSVVTIPAVREALRKGAGHNMKEILSPEVIEEFLEQIKGMPAVAKMVDQKLFNEVYREITGNKTIASMSLERPEWLDELTKSTERLERAAGATVEPVIEEFEPEVDEIHKTAQDAVEKALLEVEPEIEKLPEDQAERKGVLSGLLAKVRSAFAPAEPEKPVLATTETKDALKARLDAIKAAQAA